MLNAFILGLVQGLTEFLPVSSSGHVAFFEAVLKFKDEPGFAAAIHLATSIAAIIYFRKEILEILKSFINFRETDEKNIKWRDLGINIIIATIPALILGFIVAKLGIDNYFSSLLAIGISAIIFAVLLYYSDKLDKINKPLKKQMAFLIGASQIIAAIFPGASRSGVTLTTSFFLKLEKEFAAKFAFLISIPITALAGMNEILLEKSINLNVEFGIAFVAAFFSGLFGIYFLLYLVRKADLKWLVLYRVVFGIIVIGYYYIFPL